ncbi:phage tail domain-containing protein [Neobacillus notoginsengisoli]|nr:phage tail domain-containing protein [Neobacillus notoginsengisoli]
MDDKYRFEYFGFEPEAGYEDPITPMFERKTLLIPGKVGAWDFGIEEREKPFAFPLRIDERLHNDMQKKFDDFIAFWFDAFGKPRKVKIVRDYDPDKFYIVKIAAEILPERLPEEGNFILPLVANYPRRRFIESTENIGWDSDIPFESDISFDGEYEFQITAPQQLNIVNDGKLAIRPTIRITGATDTLTLSINGQSFSFGKITSPIDIRGEEYTVLVGGKSSFSAMNGDITKLILLPGDNLISVSGTNLNINISFTFHFEYL